DVPGIVFALNQPPAGRVETERAAGPARQHERRPAVRQIPDLDRLVIAGHDQTLAVVTEGDRRDVVAVPWDDGQGAAVGHVPQLGGAVTRSGSQQFAVGAKGDTVGTLSVTDEVTDHLTGGWVPQSDQLVPTGRSEQPTVGTEGDAADLAGMAAQ